MAEKIINQDQDKKNLRDNYITAIGWLDGIIANGSDNDKKLAQINKQLLIVLKKLI